MTSRINASGAERRIAERIAYELSARGWTSGRFVAEMREAAGLDLRRQAIDEMLPDPADPDKKLRRIRVDEYLAIAQTLSIDARDLLRPLAEVADERVGKAADTAEDAAHALDAAFSAYVTAMLDYRERCEQIPDGFPAHRRRVGLEGAHALLMEGNDFWQDRVFPAFRIADRRLDSLEVDEWRNGEAAGIWPGLAAMFQAKAMRLGIATRSRENDDADVPALMAERARLRAEGHPGAAFQALHDAMRLREMSGTVRNDALVAHAALNVIVALAAAEPPADSSEREREAQDATYALLEALNEAISVWQGESMVRVARYLPDFASEEEAQDGNE